MTIYDYADRLEKKVRTLQATVDRQAAEILLKNDIIKQLKEECLKKQQKLKDFEKEMSIEKAFAALKGMYHTDPDIDEDEDGIKNFNVYVGTNFFDAKIQLLVEELKAAGVKGIFVEGYSKEGYATVREK